LAGKEIKIWREKKSRYGGKDIKILYGGKRHGKSQPAGLGGKVLL
jgi:hypothetical protein